MRSKPKYQFEIVALFCFQLFLLLAAVIKFFTTSGSLDYLAVVSFVLFTMIFLLLLINNLYKSVEIEKSGITVRRWIGRTLNIEKTQISGYQHYRTIGALGPEESLYIYLNNGQKVGIHGKAYSNFSAIKKEIKELNLNKLEAYDYEKTYLKHLKVALPVAFLIAITLFFITKML